MIGPGSTQESWLAPTTKFTQRLTEWPWPSLGLFLSMRIYNTFILPTLLFIAQLEHPPDTTIQAENKAHKSLAAGPKGWCRMLDLQHLKDIGAPIEARSLERNAAAAMLRTAFWENSLEGGIPWAAMQHHHHYSMSQTGDVARSARQADWHRLHIASTVQQHIQNMRRNKMDKNSIRLELTKQSPLPLTKEDHLR